MGIKFVRLCCRFACSSPLCLDTLRSRIKEIITICKPKYGQVRKVFFQTSVLKPCIERRQIALMPCLLRLDCASYTHLTLYHRTSIIVLSHCQIMIGEKYTGDYGEEKKETNQASTLFLFLLKLTI